jgi:phage terminase large subunit-like protein
VLLAEISKKRAEIKLADYRPYGKHREFHEAGKTKRERLLMAGNQLGKTLAGGAEYAMHATGRYPDWWRGRTWDRPVIGWVAGVTGELTRDGPQRILMGRAGQWGTGMIPKDAIVDMAKRGRPSDALDSVVVKHGGGGDVQAGESYIGFKSYDQGREKFQSETLDIVWLDEEPPADIYTEALTRTNTTGGCLWMTFTPLQGMSEVVQRFLLEPNPDRCVTTMTIDDVGHYSPEQKASVIASYPAHEREARARGVPVLGSGRIFPIEDSAIEIEPFAIPRHWARICGLDFGWDHPTAASWLAWDRDTDTVYVYDCYRQPQETVPVHAHAIKAKGAWIPVSWPGDGLNETAAGPQLAKQYRDAGVNMLSERAHYLLQNEGDDPEKSSVSVEAGLQDLLTRMQTGRFKVFKHLNLWFEEFRMYHRKDGKVVKLKDDLMCSTRYAVMMLRHAITEPVRRTIVARPPANWRA